MDVSWRFEADALVVAVASPGPGWVAVGFHDQPQLAGSRLVMASVAADAQGAPAVRVEEHVPAPPHHPRRTRGALPTARSGSGPPTRVEVSVPLDPEVPELVVLRPGARVWLVLAWSREPDFDHHSARRTGLWVTL